jgi:mRNA interferase MazF
MEDHCMSIEAKQGEVWMVRFYPQVGSEISKLGPAIIISHDTIGRLPLKTIVPVADWKPSYEHYPWMIPITPSSTNGLSKASAIDCFQIKNFSDDRFIERISVIEHTLLQKIHQTVMKTLDPLF